MKLPDGSDRAVRDRGIEDESCVSSPVNGGVFAWDAGSLAKSRMWGQLRVEQGGGRCQ